MAPLIPIVLARAALGWFEASPCSPLGVVIGIPDILSLEMEETPNLRQGPVEKIVCC